MTDRSVMARALMYLLAAVGTAVVASVAIPGAPLADERAVPVLAGIAYAAAIGVLFGFEKLPQWGIHALLLGVTALISWSVYASGDSGSPYTIFFVWVAIYAAFFFGPWGAGFQVAAMLGGYAAALIWLGDRADSPALHWTLTASALLLLAVAIQALISRVARLMARMNEIGRADSITGLYNATAFTEMLDNEVERARRSGNKLGVVIAELDNFAAVTSGPLPAQQQQLLASVGQIFRATPRQIDLAARLGSGRFALLLPYTDEHGAYLLAERLRERISPLEGGGARMSFGVSGFPRMGANANALFQTAESALAEAHEAGGDRVMVYSRSTSSAHVEIDIPEHQIS
ncbi:MAG: diguanylate cyclase [Thermoleophilaceae bacterium]|nr:diguanylate cyclase [Thermoleophilaceae bacterium]